MVETTAQPAAPESAMPKEVVQYWDQRIRLDLGSRIGTWDSKWTKSHELVRNSSAGFRNGNLVSEFIRMFQLRLLSTDPVIDVTADDPTYTSQAESASVVAQAIARIAKLRDVLREAVSDATWANLGWIEVGHPLDPYSNDVMRSMHSPNVGPTEARAGDAYEEVNPAELAGLGLEQTEVAPFNPFEALPPLEPAQAEPQALFAPMFGYPWLTRVDPRLVVTNHNAASTSDLDYICRFRFLTRKELEAVRGYRARGVPTVPSELRSIFETVEGQSLLLFPEMLVVAEVWIIRDRNNPEYNNWHLCYLYQDPDQVVWAGPNPYGGMRTLIPVRLSKLKKLYDTTLAQELEPYADIFHVGIKAMFRDIKRMLAKKWAAAKSAGLDSEEEKKLTNDSFTGTIKASDPKSIHELVEQRFDTQLFQGLTYIKSLAQSTTGASDLDRGQAIRDITARQTQALLEATGINVEGMKDDVQEAAAECVLKLMHLVGMYHHTGRARQYTYGKNMVSMDRGTHDFTTSYLYDVQVLDNKQLVSNEERLVWVQFLRLVLTDTSGALAPYLDLEALARATVRKFGEGPQLLSSRGANRPAQGPGVPLPPEMLAGVEGGELGNLLPFGGAPGAAELQEAVQGQHPERGTRGVGSMSNQMTGLGKMGSGMGER